MRHSLLISAAILAGCLLIGLLAGRSSTGQNPVEPARVGRYQVAILPDIGPTPVIVICDTTNGKCLVKSSSLAWTEVDLPQGKK